MAEGQLTGMEPIGLDIAVDVAEHGACAWLIGVLDLYTAPRLREAMVEVLAGRNEPFVVTLDVSGLDFVDSSGLGVLIAVLKRLRHIGGNLVLRAPSRSLGRLLDLTGLDKVFTVEVDGNVSTVEVDGNVSTVEADAEGVSA
jgi:anti-sigma B factor antagonist